MPDPVLLVEVEPVPEVLVEPVPADVVEEPTDEPVPVADCDETPLDAEFVVDDVDQLVLEEVLELSSPSTFTSGWSLAQEAR